MLTDIGPNMLAADNLSANCCLNPCISSELTKFEPELSGCGLDSLEHCWRHQDSRSDLVNTFFLCVFTFSPYHRPHRFVSLECQKERQLQWFQSQSMVHPLSERDVSKQVTPW